jgi:UrcA family protein
MLPKATVLNSRWVLGAAVACTLMAGNAVAASDVTVAFHVKTQGLDLSKPAGAHELYLRVQYAARQVCAEGDKILAPVADMNACTEKALANAIRSINRPLLTQAYLSTHTPAQAAAYGIEAPPQVAAK